MIRYSTLQKKAVIALVFEAMIVDNEEINNKRSSYLQVVSELMQISNNLFKDAMENMPHEECVAILNDMSLLEKSRVAIIIYQMFTSDGDSLTERHKLFFNNIDQGAHIKQALITTGLINWVSNVKLLF